MYMFCYNFMCDFHVESTLNDLNFIVLYMRVEGGWRRFESQSAILGSITHAKNER